MLTGFDGLCLIALGFTIGFVLRSAIDTIRGQGD